MGMTMTYDSGNMKILTSTCTRITGQTSLKQWSFQIQWSLVEVQTIQNFLNYYTVSWNLITTPEHGTVVTPGTVKKSHILFTNFV